MAQWQTKSSRIVHETPWHKLVEDKVIRPDGKEGTYTYLGARTTVGAVPIHNNQIFLFEDYHYPIKRNTLQFALGGMHDKTGTPLEAAQDELLEEAGIKAKTWIALPKLYTAPGLANISLYLFLAIDLEFLEQQLEGTEITSKPQSYSIQEVKNLIAEGTICTDLVIAGLYHTIMYLENTHQ